MKDRGDSMKQPLHTIGVIGPNIIVDLSGYMDGLDGIAYSLDTGTDRSGSDYEPSQKDVVIHKLMLKIDELTIDLAESEGDIVSLKDDIDMLRSDIKDVREDYKERL